jgi:hypothetical protein
LASNFVNLLAAIDSLITKHGPSNPELLKDLLLLRAELQRVSATREPLKRAAAALRIATWVKFILDVMDDGP